MSIDMGGPFNKRYVFGTAQLAEGNFEVMAAVMAGGMVPPIAIALCTTFLRRSLQKRTPVRHCKLYYGIILYHRGSDSLCSTGSPSRDSCLWDRSGGCRRPFHGIRLYLKGASRRHLRTTYHGNPLMYLAAVMGGAVAGCLILGLLKKNIEE